MGRKNLQTLKFTHSTTDGRRVASGTFPLVNSEGLPLEVLLMALKEANMVHDWVDFLRCAHAAGWNLPSLHTRIVAAVSDVYGKDHADAVEARLEACLLFLAC